MAKTLAELLAGGDMEGGENFCDSVYNFLKNQGKDINLITNSGFGVWSQSDAAKGLASLPYTTGNGVAPPSVGDAVVGGTSTATGKVISYTTTGGDWTLGTAVGVVTLGAVTGTYQTGEVITFGGVETAAVGADGAIGVKNDPCNNDSTGLWTDDGVNITLAFAAAEYTVVTAAANQRAWIVAAALTAGKIYKIELDIKDGTVAARDVEGYFNDGVAQYGRTMTTAAGWVSVSWVFECATTTAAGLVGFRVVPNMGGGGNNFEIRRFSCYEITPCCTAADALACDGWEKDVSLDIYRQHSDGGTLTKDGAFYSLKMVPSAVTDSLRFPLSTIYGNNEWLQQFAGRPVTVGMWVKTSTALHAIIRVRDGVSWFDSPYHSGGGAWEWLEVTASINASPTFVYLRIQSSVAPNVDGSTIIYISQPMFIFGSSIGENMYQPRLQEIIRLDKRILSNLLVAAAYSDVVFTTLNIEADSDAMLPKGCKMVKIRATLRDSGSAGANCYLGFRKNNAMDWEFFINLYGLVNDTYKYLSGEQTCNEDGDVEYSIEATGAGTLDIVLGGTAYLGVQVN